MTETWRDIPNFEGLYQVSDLGNVRSLVRLMTDARTPKRVLKFGVNKKGRRQVTLSKNGVVTRFQVHILVLTAFVGPRVLGTCSKRKSADYTDNRLANLAWTS